MDEVDKKIFRRLGEFGREWVCYNDFNIDELAGCAVDTVYSINSVPIRLTAERWYHIVENHDDLAGHYDDVLYAVENPDFVLRGYKASFIAVRGAGRGQYLCVVYKEIKRVDGFVISAYLTSQVNRKQIIWRRER